jgi:hypothetical protein
MNEPMWDLGDLSVEAGFGDDQDRMMEATTIECASSAYSRLALYKTMSDLLWSLWGFIQLANNPREDFLTSPIRWGDSTAARCGWAAPTSAGIWMRRARATGHVLRNTSIEPAQSGKLQRADSVPQALQRRLRLLHRHAALRFKHPMLEGFGRTPLSAVGRGWISRPREGD